jgi:hypothetical protein
MRRALPNRGAGVTRAAGLLLPALAALVLLLAGCEAVFTTSFLSFLQRDPAKLPADQQVAWAEQALASGDPAAMAEAYELVKDDPDNELLAAKLALELSGVAQVMSDMIKDLDTILDFTTGQLQTYLEGFLSGIDAAYAAAAGAHFTAALAADPSQLSGQDMILGALSLGFSEAAAAGDFGTPANFPLTGLFIDDCLAVPPPAPADDVLTLLEGLTP